MCGNTIRGRNNMRIKDRQQEGKEKGESLERSLRTREKEKVIYVRRIETSIDEGSNSRIK